MSAASAAAKRDEKVVCPVVRYAGLRRVASGFLMLMLASTAASGASAQQAVRQNPQDESLALFLRYDSGGTDNIVRALQFSPDGNTLYVAGWNKVIQVYRSDPASGQFQYEPRINFRVPISQGRYGMLEAMAVSSDGRWLAAAGAIWEGLPSGTAAFLWPRGEEPDEILQEIGAIYVFDTQTRECRVLRGHRGSVRQLCFVDGDPNHDRLISVGFEYSGQQIAQSVRAWSLSSGKMIGQPLSLPRVIIPPSTDIAPRIRAWMSADSRLNVAVAAWKLSGTQPVGDLQIWNPESASAPRRLADSPVPFALEVFGTPRQPRLYSGGGGAAVSFIMDAGGQFRRRPIAGALAAETPFAATTLTAVSPAPGAGSAAAETLAVVSIQRLANGDKDYSLSLVSNDRSRRLGRLWLNRGSADFGSGLLIEPSIAASADGRLLAVSGSQENDVRIYRASELKPAARAGAEIPPMQILTNQLVVPRRAVFVQNAGRRGIAVTAAGDAASSALNRGAPLPPQYVVLDADSRQVQSDVSGWTVSTADPGDWQIQVGTDRQQAEVSNASQGHRQLLQIAADFRARLNRYEVTAVAVCDQQAGRPALAAVASHVQGEPLLVIYDATTGYLLRMLQGHDRRITDLCFSDDGSILLSASLDGTVRGWLLKDLQENNLSRIGWLKGLLVTTREGRVVVDEIVPETPAARTVLKPGDQISGILRDGKPVPFSTASEFYLQVSRTAPQNHSTLSLQAVRGSQRLQVELPVEQGADLREPLFSLLLSDLKPDEPAEQRGWLIWSPLGQFDVFGARMEHRLGWHINTRNDRSPVTFSSIDQFRDRFYFEGLMQHLLDGSPAARRAATEPRIRLSLVTDDGQVLTPNYEDTLILRRPEGHLVLEFEDQTGELVRSASWSLPDQAAQPFDPVERDLWKSAASVSQLGRGEHMVLVRVMTTDEPAVEHLQTVFVRYQPAAPSLKLESPAQTAGTVNTPRVPLRVAVDLAVPATLTVEQFTADEPADDKQPGDTQRQVFTSAMELSGVFEQELTLKPGRNLIRVTVVNNDIPASLAGYTADEQAVVETSVDFTPVGAPTIRLDRITDASGVFAPAVSDGRLISDADEITLFGTISGPSVLTEASLVMADRQTTLTGFRPDEQRQFEFQQSVRLQPGLQMLTVQASSGGQKGEVALQVEYRPRLPELVMISPREERLTVSASKDALRLPVTAGLTILQPHAFHYEIAVDGITQPASALQFDAGTKQLSGEVLLTADPTRERDERKIELRLSNEWEQQSVHPLQVEFLHPPEIVRVDVQREEGVAAVNLVCLIRSAETRPVTSMQIRVNDIELQAAEFRSEPSEAGMFTVTVTRIPLVEGSNAIQVRAGNRDGLSGESLVHETVMPPPQKAEVSLIRPLTNTTSIQPTAPIAFVVQSETELFRVDLIVERDHRQPQRISLLDPSAVPQSGTDQTFEHTLALTAGINRIRIEVQNRGGVTARDVSVTYLPPPVSLQLTNLSAADDSWTVPVVEPSGGRTMFDRPANEGQAVLSGKVSWIPGHRPAGDSWTIRVWVNGFLRSLRVPAPDEAAGSVDFRVPVVLNQDENRLRVEAPEISFSDRRLAMEDHRIPALQDITVRCASPEQRQRLHLVMMGVQMEEGRNVSQADELQRFASEALRLEAPESAFAEIRNYAPLVGEKAVGRNLRTLMVLVETEVSQRRASGRVNDVVMFYYQGREFRDGRGEFVLEDFQNFENPLQHPQSVTENYLARLFEHLPGAHVVFLDVENGETTGGTASGWPQFPNLGLFRIAWSGKQPIPAPPGPLLSTVRSAGSGNPADTAVRLGTLEKAFHETLGNSGPQSRFSVETFVPEDLLNLVVARYTANGRSPTPQE